MLLEEKQKIWRKYCVKIVKIYQLNPWNAISAKYCFVKVAKAEIKFNLKFIKILPLKWLQLTCFAKKITTTSITCTWRYLLPTNIYKTFSSTNYNLGTNAKVKFKINLTYLKREMPSSLENIWGSWKNWRMMKKIIKKKFTLAKDNWKSLGKSWNKSKNLKVKRK